MCEANSECHGGLVPNSEGGLDACLNCHAGRALLQGMLGSHPPGLPLGWPQDDQTWDIMSDGLKTQFVAKAKQYNGQR